MTTTCKCIAHLPKSLVAEIDPPNSIRDAHLHHQRHPLDNDVVKGVLFKRGKINPAFQRRYFELTLESLTYYCGDDMRGVIPLSTISTVQSHADPSVAWGIELVTPARTWVLSAANGGDYRKWTASICQRVSVDAVAMESHRELHDGKYRGVCAVQVELSPTYSVADAVKYICACYMQTHTTVTLHPFDPTDYVLEATAMTKSTSGRWKDPARKVASYDEFQTCCAAKETLEVTLVLREEKTTTNATKDYME
ncbi:Aste57867_19628 [Aphanomyces stellatus]|uniref:Aste57867_19628 protein n=1 Tax=Aphanomyces stellatus TaxID=120398 RepID=A0A485LDN8_9STRA|nr:hypothetical protein As57867_019563 [Aphanomyces stellatus]VFT96328.1 Aste57867_19628 [Aphanomyces stellatus]